MMPGEREELARAIGKATGYEHPEAWYGVVSAIAPIIERMGSEREARLIAERDVAIATAGLADRAFKRFISEQPDLMAALQAGISEGQASATAAIVADLRGAEPWHGVDPHTANFLATRYERGDHLKNPIDR